MTLFFVVFVVQQRMLPRPHSRSVAFFVVVSELKARIWAYAENGVALGLQFFVVVSRAHKWLYLGRGVPTGVGVYNPYVN